MKNKSRKLFTVGALSVVMVAGGLTGCYTGGRGSEAGGRTPGQVMDDQRITSRIQEALKTSPVYKYPDVNVSAFQGTVQLSGFVSLEEQKRQAGQIAQNVQGVRQVVNNIVLKPTPAGLERDGLQRQQQDLQPRQDYQQQQQQRIQPDRN